MHNKNGGYENDCSVARLQDNRFMLMSPSIQQMKSYAWMRHQLIQLGFEDSVYLQDVTSLYTSLCIMGPKSKETLGKLTDVDLSTTNFPYFTCRHMDVSCSPEILTMNMTHDVKQPNGSGLCARTFPCSATSSHVSSPCCLVMLTRLQWLLPHEAFEYWDHRRTCDR